MTDFHKMWYVGNGGHKYYQCALSSQMRIFNISLAYTGSDQLVTK